MAGVPAPSPLSDSVIERIRGLIEPTYENMVITGKYGNSVAFVELKEYPQISEFTSLLRLFPALKDEFELKRRGVDSIFQGGYTVPGRLTHAFQTVQLYR